MASGGYEFNEFSSALGDRLYINKGALFTKTAQVLPNAKFEISSVVAPSDYDDDGDIDLFIGIRAMTTRYGLPATSYILQNDGNGSYKTLSSDKTSALADIGMVTSAEWVDIDNDNDLDLVIVGEWMKVTVLLNNEGTFEQMKNNGLEKSAGWWNLVKVMDLNGDGYVDIIAGNHGLNSRFNASDSKPVSIYINDFDRNGQIEQVLTQYNGDVSYPLALRHDLIKQMPGLKKKYLKYENYKEQQIQDIFSIETVEQAFKLEVSNLASTVFMNNGGLSFTSIPLPMEAQFSNVFALSFTDFNLDGNADLVLGGNFYASKPEVGRYDAQYGLLLEGIGDGSFKSILSKDSGFELMGETRDFVLIETSKGNTLISAGNNEPLQRFIFKN